MNEIAPRIKDREATGETIRSISRGIAVLQVINRLGSATMTQISEQAKVPYPTAVRIVHTLLDEMLIEREPDRPNYRPTSLVHTLSLGYQSENHLVTVSERHIQKLCAEVHWPIATTTRVGSSMIVRNSTHAMTSLTYSHYYPGYTFPITECASGRAYLAFCSPEVRNIVLDHVLSEHDAATATEIADQYSERYWAEIREAGYATQANNLYNANPGKTSAIAVPIFENGEVCGAMAMIFFKTGSTLEAAIDAHLDKIKNTACLISAELSA